MSSLLYLEERDFAVKDAKDGKLLCMPNISGWCMVLFYSNSKSCIHCPQAVHVFRQLPGTIGGCTFGIINISTPQSKKIIELSKITTSKLTYVPYSILYYNGTPYVPYSGPYDTKEIPKFISDVAKDLQKQQMTNIKQKNSETVHSKNTSRSIPGFTLGRPLYGIDNKVCYLTELELHKTKQ